MIPQSSFEPEIFIYLDIDISYNSSSDMWAAGCLLFEMCLLRMPFNAPDFTSLVLKILQGDYDPIPR